MMDFATQRAAALAILSKGHGMTRKAGQFLGQLAAHDAPLTEKQVEWFSQLAERAGVQLEAANDD